MSAVALELRTNQLGERAYIITHGNCPGLAAAAKHLQSHVLPWTMEVYADSGCHVFVTRCVGGLDDLVRRKGIPAG